MESTAVSIVLTVNDRYAIVNGSGCFNNSIFDNNSICECYFDKITEIDLVGNGFFVIDFKGF